MPDPVRAALAGIWSRTVLGSLPGFGVSGAPWPHSQSGSILITIAPGYFARLQYAKDG